MSEQDYTAISKIIEEVIGKDTILCVKLLEGIKFYFDNKIEKFKIINENYPSTASIESKNISIFSRKANIAMEKYTKNLQKDISELKANGKYCGIKG